MPRIPVRTAGAVPTSRLNVRADADSFGAATGRAISQLGATVGDIGVASIRADKKAVKLEKERLKNEAVTQIHRYRAAQKENDALYVKDNPDATQEDRTNNFDQFAKDYQANNEFNSVATKAFEQNAIDLKSVMTLDAIEKDTVRGVELQIDSIDKTAQSLINTVITDPSQIQSAITEMQGLLTNNTMLKDDVRRDKLTKFIQDATAASFKARLDKESSSYSPNAVLKELNSGKFDNMLSSSDKAALSERATVKADEETFTQNVSDLQAAFPNPQDRIHYLTHTNAEDIQKRFGVKAGNVMRIARDVRSQMNYERNQRNAQQEEVKRLVSQEISDLYEAGDIAGAERLAHNSDVFPTIQEQTAILNAMRAESAQHFDPAERERGLQDMAAGKITESSQIFEYKVSKETRKLLEKKLAERKSRLGDINYLDEAKKDYTAFRKQHPEVTQPMGIFLDRVRAEQKKQDLSDFDAGVTSISQSLMTEVEGTGGFFSRDKFGIEIPSPVNRIQSAADVASPVTLPQYVIDKLKEGQDSTLGNGQVWTIRNGEPVRVK